MNIITPSLEATGLTTQQATLYELLLGRGRERASRLVRETPWKRGVVYKILAELVELGLVEEKDARKRHHLLTKAPTRPQGSRGAPRARGARSHPLSRKRPSLSCVRIQPPSRHPGRHGI